MRGSRSFAGLLGVVLIGLALSDAVKLDIWMNSPTPVAYLSSLLLLAGGLLLVLVHARWTGGRHGAVALLGWLAIVGGLAWHVAVLDWPAVVSGLARFLAAPWFGGGTARDTNARLAQIDVLLASGLFLTFAAWGSRQGGE